MVPVDATDITHGPVRLPAHRVLTGLARDPLGTLERIGRDNDGAVVRLSLGAVRPFLFTAPDQVQRVLRERPEQYTREGMLWKPLRRLEGDGIAGEGPIWARSRRLLQPVFTAKHIAGVLDPMAEAISSAVQQLDRQARSGALIDVAVEMTRVVHRSLIRAFFGDRISPDEAERLGQGISTAFASLGWRILLPFAPDWVRLPGDGAFRRAVRTIDEIIYPHVRRARRTAGGTDLLSLLAGARDERGRPLDDRSVRDDVVAMFVAGTETTALALTWTWVMLDAHKQVAATLQDEVDRVVGDGVPAARHIAALAYTKMVLQETMRLYPIGWLIPRTVTEPDVVDGVRIPAGATVLLSPYLTQRLPSMWERPDEFDPRRFAPQRSERRHRFAYFPFGAGVHQCLGSHFFTVEAQLIVASVLSRYRTALVGSELTAVRAAATLRPRRPVAMALRLR
jgi:cytochrome P450